MSDHRTFLKTLPNDVAVSLVERSDKSGILHLAGHLLVLVFLGGWIASGLPFWSLAILPYGIALSFLFTLEHEATHKTPFASEPLNEWVGRACGLIIILPFEWFRYFHLAHHRHTNIPGKDPELESPKPESVRHFLWIMSGIPYWKGVIRQTMINALGRADGEYLPKRARARIALEARIMLLIYGAALFSLGFSSILVWLWIVPAIVGQPFVRIYLMAEHGGCEYVPDMFENTRTTFTNRIVRFFAWNMPFHAEHHAHPNVPFYKLPEFHSYTRTHLKVTSESYSQFAREHYSNLKR